MKWLFVSSVALVLILSGALISPNIIYADTQAEVIKRIDSDIGAAKNFLDKMEVIGDQTNPDLVAFKGALFILKSHFEESSRFYLEKISSESDEKLKNILTKINSAVAGLSQSLQEAELALDSENETEFTTAFNRYDGYIEQLNLSVTELNDFYGTADYSWLAWPFWISLIISVVLFIMSRGSPLLPAEQLRNQFEFALFKSSLWPLGGSAISYFWYLATPPGESFYVLYGLIGVGFFQFFRGLYTYITEARPAIELAKTEEKSKLESLIRSEKFQKESMEEKVREIEKRKPVIHLGKKDNEGKYCKECGAENSKTAKYCKSCGKGL